MITESQIYWITRCDQLNGSAWFFAVGGGIVFVLASIIAAFWVFINIPFETEAKAAMALAKTLTRRVILPALITMLIGIVGVVFIPTTKEMALIKVAPALANSELVQTTIPNEAKDIYGLAKAALVEKLKGKTK